MAPPSAISEFTSPSPQRTDLTPDLYTPAPRLFSVDSLTLELVPVDLVFPRQFQPQGPTGGVLNKPTVPVACSLEGANRWDHGSTISTMGCATSRGRF